MPATNEDVRELADAITAALDRDDDLQDAVRRAVTAWVDDPKRRQATRDQLTGVFNREMFSEDLDRLVAGAHRVGMPALLVADVDDFSGAVQRHGADGADDVLRRVGQCLAEASRAEDLVARVEGDTFAVLIPGPIHRDEAVGIGERLTAVVRADETLRDRGVTISIGVAWSPELLDSVQLLTMGQQAMRKAKDTGRVELLEQMPQSEIAGAA